MTQLQRVKNWLQNEWGTSMYSLNTVNDRYYLYTFDNNQRTWEGMFWNWPDDEIAKKHKHVLDLKTMEAIR